MTEPIGQTDLEAYLDEALRPEEMARIEKALRKDRRLARRLAATAARRDAGVHSLGEIWRRHRISCPSRRELGNYLLEALPSQVADFVTFHLEVTGCRYCHANLTDLRKHQEEARQAVESRRRKYFQSSADYLGKA